MALDVQQANPTGRRLFTIGIAAYLLAWIGVTWHLVQVFWYSPVMWLAVVESFPLIAAFRMRRRWPAVKPSEIVYPIVLISVASGGAYAAVSNWYGYEMHRDHAEDLQYAELERLMREDPAFRHVEIRLSDRKHIYWLEGTVPTDADLKRLYGLAARCRITDRRLDGPFVHSVSLKVMGDGR